MGYTLPFSFAQQRTKPNMNPLILLTACVAASQAQIIAAPYGLGAPLTYGAAPIAYQTAAAPAPVVTVNAAPAPVVAAAPLNPSSQFQAQDEFGNIQYGYSNINSQKHETGNTYGGVSGSYSYVDANGIVQTRQYIADGLGFRVQATNLPVAPAAPEVELPVAPVHEYELPVAPVFEGKAPVHEYTLPVAPVYDGVAPAPVEDTPEVAAAKAEHLALLAAASERKRRSTPADTEVLAAPKPVLATAPVVAPVAPLAGYPYAAGLPYAGYAGYGYAGFPAAGLPYAGLPYAGLPAVAPAAVAPAAVVASAPATAEAELHTYKLTPGHATAYRVY